MTAPRVTPVPVDDALWPWAVYGAVTGLAAVGVFALLVRVVGRVTGRNH